MSDQYSQTFIPEDRQIRMATESTFNAPMTSQRAVYPQSIMTPDSINDALIAGLRYNGRISNVRRFFCLFVTFDVFFTILLWLICIVIAGANVQTAFVDEIVHYKIKTSLFDIVVAAIARFVILLSFYAVLHINHWFIVALSTSSTCAFLIAKVFLYDWTRTNQPVFDVLLILTSFVLVWSEVWFLDIKVIPQELLVRDWYSAYTDPERAPLLHSNLTVPSATSRESVGNFYTPMDSPDHSDEENQVNKKKEDSSNSSFLSANNSVKLSPDKAELGKTQALALPKRCVEIITSPDWKVEKTTPEGDVISYMHLPKPDGKIFKITAVIEIAAQKLINDLFDNIETNFTWNKQITESKKIYAIDQNIDFVYQATAPLANGTVGPRDFIILRNRAECNSYFLSCGSSVDFTVIPTRKSYVRGENGVGCYAARALDNNKCEFVWLLNTKLKGWIPQKMIDMFMPIGMIEFITALRQHVKDIKD